MEAQLGGLATAASVGVEMSEAQPSMLTLVVCRLQNKAQQRCVFNPALVTSAPGGMTRRRQLAVHSHGQQLCRAARKHSSEMCTVAS